MPLKHERPRSTSSGTAVMALTEQVKKAALEARIRRDRRAVLVVNTHARSGGDKFEQAQRLLQSSGIELVSSIPVDNADAVQVVEDTSRECAAEMMRLRESIDVLIPRGGAGLIRSVVENSTVPVIETGIGICHTYVDESADLAMAADIAFNAKVSRPGVCNSMETLLVHRGVAERLLPSLLERFSRREWNCGAARRPQPATLR